MKISKFLQFLKKRWRILTGLVIVAAAIYFSVSIIFGHGEKTPPQPLFVIGENPRSEASGNLRFSLTPLPNLTDQFIDKSLEKLVAENQAIAKSGLRDANKAKIVPDPTDVEQIISSIIDDQALAEKVNKNDLLVGDDSQISRLLYVFLINEIVRTKLNEVSAIDPSLYKTITEYFSNVAARFDETTELLKGMRVPAFWLDTHVQLVEFSLKQRNIFQALAAAETDPLNFYVAAYKMIPLELENKNELQKIISEMAEKLKNEKDI